MTIFDKLRQLHKIIALKHGQPIAIINRVAVRPHRILAEYPVDQVISKIRRDKSATTRLEVSKKIRVDVYGRKKLLYRDLGTTCCRCNRTATLAVVCRSPQVGHYHVQFVCDYNGHLVPLTIDHKHPKWAGGTLSKDNCQIMCAVCNHQLGPKLGWWNKFKYLLRTLIA